MRYASPELVMGEDTRSLPNDTWAWGCFLLEVSKRLVSVIPSSDLRLQTSTGILPYPAVSDQMKMCLAHVNKDLPADVSSLKLPPVVRDILRRCWKPVEQRAHMPQCAKALSAYINSLHHKANLADLATTGAGWEVKTLSGVTDRLKLQRLPAFDDFEEQISRAIPWPERRGRLTSLLAISHAQETARK